MGKNCVVCNRKIGLLEKRYENKYCKECYAIIQEERAEEKRRIEEERKKEEEITKLENLFVKIKTEKEEKEKIDIARDYLLYTNYYWAVIGNISLMPFHYEDIFNKSITNKFEIIKLLLDGIIKELPKAFSFNDIKQITTYRNSSKIIHDVLKNYTNQNIDNLKYCKILVENQQYAPKPNDNILDDIDENSCLLDNTILFYYNDIIQSFIDNKSKTINAFQKNIDFWRNRSNQPNKYDTEDCITNLKELQIEQSFPKFFMNIFKKFDI